ncbi:replicative DNA helicase [Bacillus ectoiniformans]|uniref:DnaB-like helicase C-terminal domain-containing protein n=1 Tax=Bacillus ectoiniformans TaxID=1494429 RepID=UPI0019582D62|nr:DnaB-like helicase C-terminal domain-containing protein [Bacillus ectoiniformans]MBM7650523.1 replicative DNA helicase [Bacillus ectoiniformans]
MKISELESKINLYSLIEESHQIQKTGKNYVINPCPVCGSRDHFFVYPKTNSYSSFSKCCKGGSVYKYLQEVVGLNEEQAYRQLYNLAGEIMTNERELNSNGEMGRKTKNTPSQPAEVKGQQNISIWLNELYQKQTIDDKRYFVERGIAPALIDMYKLSVYHDKDGRWAMLPIFANGEIVSYTSRAIDGQTPKYKNKKGEAPLFNIDYIQQEQDSPIFITEGIMDALTLESKGYKAIALGGVDHVSKLIQAIQDNKAQDINILTAFDNDEAGRRAASDLPFKRLEIPKPYEDLNEWGTAELKAHRKKDDNFKALKDNIEEQLKHAAQPDAVSDYLEQGFNDDIEAMKPYKDKKTGFDNLDKEMKGLYPGLYVVGGISSVGKTTFVHQLSDQLAEQGDHVIFFSLEQSKMEMVSKSLARTTAKLNLNDAVSSVWIRGGHKSSAVINAIGAYKETSKRVNIVEGNFNTDVNTIRNYVDDYIKFNKVRPIVVVDYLQIIPSYDDRLSDKQRIDTNVTALKRMSRDLNLSVFVISSLNRGNYLAPIDFESFKESGGIEYTADVVWGLQLEVINDELFDKKDKVKEKREKIKAAKVEDPRQIELVCLKNRNGKPSFSCTFSYWAKYDFYESNLDSQKEVFSNKKELQRV